MSSHSSWMAAAELPDRDDDYAPTPLTVLVCGSRGWSDASEIRRHLADNAGLGPDYVPFVIHGGASGADLMAAEVAKSLGYASCAYPADWKTHGKRAGYLRNLQMLDEEPVIVFAFWDGKSRGTAHTIREAKKRDLRVVVVYAALPSSGGSDAE